MAWVPRRIVERRQWAPDLITLKLDAAIEPFVPGQFVNLGLDLDGRRVRRSYSLASAARQPTELYLSLVPDGGLTPALFARAPGDALWVDDRALGFFTLEHVPPARHLWLLATGTGLGPFVAMLRSEEVWQRFERVVVAHGVRSLPHLGYADELRALAQARPGGFRYLPLVTRDPPPAGGLALRIPTAISGGQLEQRAELPLDAASCHVMLCGNPHMIDDAQAALRERGLVKHRKRAPGHVTIESYW